MAALADVILKTDTILKKYEKYDPNGPEQSPSKKARKSEDPFTDKYFDIMDRVQDLQLKSGEVNTEKNRALRAALNAELRKEKALLMEELPELARLVRSGGKITGEVEAERLERLEEAQQAVEDLGDGNNQNGGSLRPQRDVSALGAGPSTSYSRDRPIVLDASTLSAGNPAAYQHTAATDQFVRDVNVSQSRQDIALDNIERGLSTLKDLGGAMNEELERHDVLIDEVGVKMDTVTKELQTNNMKLHGLVTQVRSSRRFFIDIILLCVVLALGLYIYTMLSK